MRTPDERGQNPSTDGGLFGAVPPALYTGILIVPVWIMRTPVEVWQEYPPNWFPGDDDQWTWHQWLSMWREALHA